MPNTYARIITGYMTRNGPQDRAALRQACKDQAHPFDEMHFSSAITSMLAAGAVVVDLGDEGAASFDLPANFYANMQEQSNIRARNDLFYPNAQTPS
jgi:hypothetical protein